MTVSQTFPVLMTLIVLEASVKYFAGYASIGIYLMFSHDYTLVMFLRKPTEVNAIPIVSYHITSKIHSISMTYATVEVDFDHRAELVLGFSTVKFSFNSLLFGMKSLCAA